MDNINNENNNSLNVEETVAPEVTLDTETEVVLESEPVSEDTNEVDVVKLQEINKKLFARAKKAEEALKKQPKQDVQPKKDINNEQFITREEAILIAKGFDEEEISKVKAVAKGLGKSLSDASKDEMFVLWRENQQDETKKAKSKLGASKGSGAIKAEKSVSDMSEEEHRAYVSKHFNQ